MTNRRNFLKAMLASTVVGFLGCRDKKQWPPPMDAPLDAWKKGPNSGISSREAMARSRAYAEDYLSKNGGPRFPHRYDGDLFLYLGLSPDRVRASDARGLAQRRSWSCQWGRFYFPGGRPRPERSTQIGRWKLAWGKGNPLDLTPEKCEKMKSDFCNSLKKIEV